MGRIRRVGDGREHVLSSEEVVGRSASSGLLLQGDTVSGLHALLRWHDGRWVARDLGSRNGTTVNGTRLRPGQTVTLVQGAELMLGDCSETWQLVDAGEPLVQVVPLDGGPSLPLQDHLLVLPNPDAPACTIYHGGSEWLIEQDGEVRPIGNNQVFVSGGRSMRFECPRSVQHTPAVASHPMTLHAVCLRFRVSPDEEYVDLVLEGPRLSRQLASRSCFYLGLTLARRRLMEAENGTTDPGWVSISELLHMLPHYSESHLNVDVHRLRKELASANVLDAGTVVERRRGCLRIGASSLRVERTPLSLIATRVEMESSSPQAFLPVSPAAGGR